MTLNNPCRKQILVAVESYYCLFNPLSQTETVEEPIEDDSEATEEPEKEAEDEAEVEEEEEDKEKPKTKKVGLASAVLKSQLQSLGSDRGFS